VTAGRRLRLLRQQHAAVPTILGLPKSVINLTNHALTHFERMKGCASIQKVLAFEKSVQEEFARAA
jgi:hypothetical protein